MRRILQTTLPLALLAGLTSTPAAAQESITRGFVLGFHFTGASLVIEDGERQSAGGAGLTVGYGINRRFTIFAQADGARFDDVPTADVDGGDWTLGHFDLGARFNFANSLRAWVPYLQASFTGRVVSVSGGVSDGSSIDEASISGGSFTLGGGFDVYFTETLALDLQLLWSGGEFTRLTVENVTIDGFDLDATSARLNLGVAWWP